MKYFFTFLIGLLLLQLHAHAIDVTFKVDVSNEDITNKTVYVTGTIGDSHWNLYEMTESSTPNIYELTLDASGDIEYKFVIENWDGQEDMTGSGCSDNNNRKMTVEGTDPIILDAEVFNTCSNKNYVDVTFQVNMQNETLVDGKVFIVELNGQWEQENWIEMSDDDDDKVFTATVTLKEGSQAYRYNNGSGWNDENLTGQECSSGDSRNRALEVISDNSEHPTQEVDVVAYNSCSDIPVVEVYKDVTFKVDVNSLVDVTGDVYIASSWNDWNPDNFTAMSDEDGDGIWEGTVSLRADLTHEYKFTVGKDWGNIEDITSTCNKESTNNRYVELDGTSDALVLEVVAFNSCTSAAPQYDITFTVNLSNETVVTPAIVLNESGTTLETETALVETENPGFYNVTLSLTQGVDYDYLFVNNSEYELERSDCNDGYHRTLTVNGSSSLSTVVYGECTTPREEVDVTFQVDMNDEELVDGNVFIIELNGEWEQENWVAMSDEDGDGIFTATVTLLEGNQVFRYNNGSGWNDEDLTGQDCASGDSRNRSLTVVSDGSEDPQQVLDVVAFNSCTSTPPVRTYKDVTFKVDVNSLVDVTGDVYIASSWNDWNPDNFTAMSDEDGDGIWEGTVSLRADLTHEYKFTVGQDWDNIEDITSTCNKEETNNRYVELDGTSDALVLEVVAFNSCTSAAPLHDVTFRVDLSNETTSTPSIVIALTGEDLVTTTPLVQVEESSIWEVTLSLSQGSSYDYLFVNNEEQEPSREDCGEEAYHRSIIVTDSETLSTVVYDECTTPKVYVDVTFQVDMNNEELVDGKVFIVELNGEWEQANWIAMSDEDEDGIFTATVSLEEGDQVFRYNNGSDWNDEDLTGKDCASVDSRNRSLTVVSDGSETPSQVLEVVAFNSCTSAAPLHDVTFRVDLSNETASTPSIVIALTGEDLVTTTPLVQVEESSIWEVTLSLSQGSSYDYLFVNNEEQEPSREDCGEEAYHRSITVTDSETLSTVVYDECTTPKVYVDVTFQVDMNNEELVDGKVFIVELNGEWEQANWVAMSDEDEDGIFTATVSLEEGDQVFRYNNGSDWNDEDLTGKDCASGDSRNRSLTVVSDGSETPAQVLDVVAFNSCTSAAPLHDVTFRVDLSNETASTPSIAIALTGEDLVTTTPLVQVEESSIWEVTLSLSQGSSYDYLFVNNEEQEPSREDCGEEAYHRSITVTDSETLSTVVYDECTTPKVYVDVTFQVDMNNEELVDGKVFIVELNGEWEQANWVAMSDEDEDGIFTATVSLEEGDQVFRYNNGSDWNDEDLTGKDCASGDSRNRSLTVVSDGSETPAQVLDVVAFNSCTSSAPLHDVTFRVDLSNETASTPSIVIALTGEDLVTTTPLVQVEESSIWEVTLSLSQGSSYDYLFVNNEEQEPSREDCGEEAYHRSITVTDSETLSTVVYDECTTPKVYVDVTFQVDMNNEELVDGKVFIVELNGEWEQANWIAMSDEDEDGIFTATVSLEEGDQVFRYNNGSDWNDEDLTGKDCASGDSRNRSLTVVSDGSETPAQILEVVAFNSCTSSAPLHDVTFRVDLSNETASTPSIVIALTGEDLVTTTPLVQVEESSIWEVTLSLSQGSSYDYLFVNNEEQEPSREDCGEEAYHRSITVTDSETLSTVVYDECTTPKVYVDVTFQVDMNNEELVDGKVFIVELNGEWEQANWVAMSDEDEDGIFTAIVSLEEGDQVFRYNNGSDWNDEDLTGKECASGDSRNRSLTVVSDGSETPTQVLDVVAFNSCSSTPPASVEKMVTFKVDANLITDTSEGLYIAASWNNWTPENFNIMSDEDGDGIWETTVSLKGDRTYEFQYTVGANWDNIENLSGTVCNKEGTSNRFITLDASEDDVVLDVVAFNSCTTSTPEYKVTFSVDLTNVTASSPKLLIDLEGEQLATEVELIQNLDNETIWEVTLPLVQGKNYEYLFVNNGEQEPSRENCTEGYHRLIFVDGSEVLPTVMYDECTVEPVMVDVTFQVDMNAVTLVDGKVFIVELNGKWEPADWVEMTDEDEDGIFTATVSLEEGDQVYRYNNGSDWNDEDLSGKECAVDGGKNRTLKVVSDGTETPTQVLDIVSFNSCSADAPVVIKKEVTFVLDANSFDDLSEGVYIAANWNGWNPDNFTEMTDTNADGIYEVTVTLDGDRTHEYKFTIGKNWDNIEDMLSSGCELEGTNNRFVTLDATEDAVILDTVSFNSCTNTEIVWSAVTFNIDVSDLEEGNVPTVSGDWGNSEMIALGAGVYTKTLYLRDQATYAYTYSYGELTESFEGDCLNELQQRSITVNGDEELPVYVFNSCEESEQNPEADKVLVTFSVNLSKERPSEEKVYIAGSWASNDWNPDNFDEMSDEDGDGIWVATIELIAGQSYQYQFTVGRNWDNIENMENSGCEVEGTKNRGVTAGTEAMTLDTVCFNECSSCFINVTSISVSGSNITEKEGTSQMTATIVPLNANIQNVVWSVSDATIATIDADGLLTAKSNGTVTVIATTTEEGSTVSGSTEIVISGQIVTSLEDDLENLVKVYPNPSQGQITIEADYKINKIQVFDLNGRLIQSVNLIQSGQSKVDLNTLKKGLYLINISSDEFTHRKKVIVN